MIFEHAGKCYNTVFGSDVQRDGVFLEMTECGRNELILEAFYSDANAGFSFSCFQEVVPFEVVEFFVAEARRRLPPHSDAQVLPSSQV